MLLLHTTNWRKLEDIKQNNQTWEQLMADFLNQMTVQFSSKPTLKEQKQIIQKRNMILKKIINKMKGTQLNNLSGHNY
jgi:hypothetical protein